MKKLSQCCEICGDQATTGAHDRWCYEEDGWLCYKACNITFRCEDHDRDAIIKTSDKGIFDMLAQRDWDFSVILVEIA